MRKELPKCGAKDANGNECTLRRWHRGAHSWSWTRKLRQLALPLKESELGQVSERRKL